ncbi:MAG: ACP S-malonyltransferase [Lactobacillaceae bacterium]|jgi:[acyl-carrier-protein] S-malonyltransferase|nr:ACP S-malonyltransferase [Lactobacillaceae bacterium]
MKLGILMSGQGAQTVGMGRDLYDNVPAYRDTIDRASKVLGYDLMTTVCEDETKIGQTQYAQAAIFAMSMGIYNALADVLPKPAGFLGLSLGEYSALAAAGVLDFEQAVAILKDRGQYMQTVGAANPGKMVAVMSDDQALVETVLTDLQAQGKQVYPANFNTFAQLVMGGIEADVDAAVAKLTEAGVTRMIDLPVSGAFHTPLLAEAATQLQTRLADEAVQEPSAPVYSNTTAQPFADVIATLGQQIIKPTYFAQALQGMMETGVDTLIEFGPSNTLIKFSKKIAAKDVVRYNVADLASYQATREDLTAVTE